MYAGRMMTEDQIEAMKRRGREYYRRVRAKDPVMVHERTLKHRYGVTKGTFTALWKEQEGVCAICKQPEFQTVNNKRRVLSLDHCHKTGFTRSLLCSGCNPGLGHYREDPEILRGAADYIEQWHAVHADILAEQAANSFGDPFDL